eukprot:3087483-Pleurochrysis_carterae.AAC.1
MEGQLLHCRAMREMERSEGDYSSLLFIEYENEKYACLQRGRMCSQATRSAPAAVARIALTMLRPGAAAIFMQK